MCERYQDGSRNVKNFRKDVHTAEISISGYDPLVALSPHLTRTGLMGPEAWAGAWHCYQGRVNIEIGVK